MARCKDNLEREFYLCIYQEVAKVQPLAAQIGWSHNLVISQCCMRKTRTSGARKSVGLTLQTSFPNDRPAAGGDGMKAEQEVVELVARIQANFEELGG
jgi:hypothetical protein